MIKAVSFGERAKRSEEQRRKREYAKELGFEDDTGLDHVRRFAQLNVKDRERFLREYEARKQLELPETQPRNPNRRKERLCKLARSAPKRETERRERSVSIGVEAVKEEAKTYLRQMYSVDGEMICQVCKDTLPFRLPDGKHYFEAVEFLQDFRAHHYQNYLALCPNHAAMYMYAREEVSFDKNLLEDNQLPITLAGEKHTLYFTKTHIFDLVERQEFNNQKGDGKDHSD